MILRWNTRTVASQSEGTCRNDDKKSDEQADHDRQNEGRTGWDQIQCLDIRNEVPLNTQSFNIF